MLLSLLSMVIHVISKLMRILKLMDKFDALILSRFGATSGELKANG